MESAYVPAALSTSFSVDIRSNSSAGAVGATGRFGQAERKWFVSQLANIAADLGIRSWSDMKASLKEVIWHEYQDEVQHRELWEEVDRQAESDEDA